MSTDKEEGKEGFEEEEGKGVWLKITIALGLTIAIAGLLDYGDFS